MKITTAVAGEPKYEWRWYSATESEVGERWPGRTDGGPDLFTCLSRKSGRHFIKRANKALEQQLAEVTKERDEAQACLEDAVYKICMSVEIIPTDEEYIRWTKAMGNANVLRTAKTNVSAERGTARPTS